MARSKGTRFTMVAARRSDELTATKRAKRILYTLLAAAMCGVLAIVISIATSMREVDLSSVDPQGRAVADVAAFEIVNRQPLSVPVARTFDTDTARELMVANGNQVTLPFDVQDYQWESFSLENFSDDTGQVTQFEVHNYIVFPRKEQPVTADQAGKGKEKDGSDALAEGDIPNLRPIRLSVGVLISPSGPRLAGLPSFAPWAPSYAAPDGEGDYSNYSNLQIELSSQAQDQLVKWAQAYVSDDRPALLSLTGDADPGHQYIGLNKGFRIPEGAAAASGAVQVLYSITAGEDQAVSRVRVAVENPAPGIKKGEDPFRTYMDFDVLISELSSAQPKIQSWGPAGSAASLEPFSVAVPVQ